MGTWKTPVEANNDKGSSNDFVDEDDDNENDDDENDDDENDDDENDDNENDDDDNGEDDNNGDNDNGEDDNNDDRLLEQQCQQSRERWRCWGNWLSSWSWPDLKIIMKKIMKILMMKK